MSETLSEELNRNIPLLEMIETLRIELAAAMETSRNERLRFDVEEVDLELQIKVTRGGQGNAGLKFWVVSVGGGANKGDETVHTFRLKLKPRIDGGPGPVTVSSTMDKLPG